VPNPIVISHSLIFDGTTVSMDAPIDRLILTPYGNVDCRSELGMSQLGASPKALHAAQD
jgi:hypothetical protein